MIRSTLYVLEHVVGYTIGVAYCVGMVLLLNGVITWREIWPLLWPF